jgi:putative restriction endonuclease
MVYKRDLFVANTDHDWFNYLKNHPELPQVNFWQPSNQLFRVMEEGGIFFFRRKAPINKIGGFGILASSHNASIGLLWDDLGISNGVESEEDFVARVKKYRKSSFVDRTTQVGL